MIAPEQLQSHNKFLHDNDQFGSIRINSDQFGSIWITTKKKKKSSPHPTTDTDIINYSAPLTVISSSVRISERKKGSE